MLIQFKINRNVIILTMLESTNICMSVAIHNPNEVEVPSYQIKQNIHYQCVEGFFENIFYYQLYLYLKRPGPFDNMRNYLESKNDCLSNILNFLKFRIYFLLFINLCVDFMQINYIWTCLLLYDIGFLHWLDYEINQYTNVKRNRNYHGALVNTTIYTSGKYILFVRL